MKRFFLISLMLHGAVLFLFFSWGIPLGERSLPRNVIQVLLVVEENGGGIFKKDKNHELRKQVKTREAASPKVSRERKMPPSKPRPIVENPPQKPEGVPPALLVRTDEEKARPKPEGNRRQGAETKESKPDPERKSGSPARLTLPAPNEERAQGGPIPPPEILPAQAHSGSAPTVLASGSPLLGKEDVWLGEGKSSSTGGASLPMSRAESPSAEGDSLLAKIVGKIEAAKRYPRAARRMGIQGTATVRFKLRPNGKLEKIELLESSGSKLLDDASMETVRQAAPLPYKEGWLKVGIVFKIL
jgi:protein TonB